MDSPERASDALSALEGATQDASREALAPLEDGIPAGGPPSVGNIVGEAPFTETAVGPLLSARHFNLAIRGPCKPRGSNRLVLNSSVKPMKWDHPPAYSSVPGLYFSQSIINHWNPFNKRDSSVIDMRELYPTNLRIPVVALSEEYSIPFPDYLDKKSYQCVAEYGMYIHNHDFNETTELVWSDF